MKPDQERVKTLLSQTVTLLCKNGLHYEKELRIQGLLGITIDCESVFIVHFNESLSDFTSDVAPLLATGAASVEGCPEKPEKSRSAGVFAGKPVTVFSETEADKSCSSLDDIRKPSPLHESGHPSSENVEMQLSLDEDLKTVKTERNSEDDDGDDVVLVESENEQDIGSVAGSLFPTSCNESVESRMRRDNRRHRQSLPPIANSSKRRRFALPAPMESTAVYGDDGGGSNYNVKMEPHSSEYLGSGEQGLPYDEGYPEHSWDNSKTIFNQADNVEDLTSVPGCSSWDGFDLQARGSATSGAAPRSNELYHESIGQAEGSRKAMSGSSRNSRCKSRLAMPSSIVTRGSSGKSCTRPNSRPGEEDCTLKVIEISPVLVEIMEDLPQNTSADQPNFSQRRAVKRKEVSPPSEDSRRRNSKDVKRRRQYSHDQLMKAVSDITNGMSVRKASLKWSIPRMTLQDIKHRQYKVSRKSGPDPILKEEEELSLVESLMELSRQGIRIAKDNLLDRVQNILRTDPRSNPFKDNRPGNTWFKLFLQRHPQISQKHAEAICETMEHPDVKKEVASNCETMEHPDVKKEVA